VEQDLRAKLADELSATPEPPIGDLIDAALRRGRRLRTVRRLQAGAAALLGLTVLTVAAVTLPDALGGRGSEPVAAPPALRQSPRPRVPATPAGLLELLLSLLPPGPTSNYAADPEQPMVQTYLDTGAGPGMLRLTVTTVQRGSALFDAPGNGIQATGPSELPGGGEVVVLQIPENCIQRTVVEVRHPDDTLVQINIASCLAWDGTANKPAPQVLTAEQAATIAADPRWGTRLDPSLEDAGAAHFPELPEIA
jgi:hypothetical protein